jgi:hypothetical protein
MPPSTPKAVLGTAPSCKIRVNPKALSVGGIALGKERLERVTRLGSGGTFGGILVYFVHTESAPEGSTAVKGIIAFSVTFVGVPIPYHLYYGDHCERRGVCFRCTKLQEYLRYKAQVGRWIQASNP